MDQSIRLDNVETAGHLGRAERRDAAANRRLIVETAQRLFAERGVAAVSMTEIAEVAGIGKGTLYRRFANKGELCLALMDDQMTRFQNEKLEQMRAMTAEGLPWLEQLARFLDALVYFIEDNVPLLCEVQAEGLVIGGRIGLPHYWHYLTISGLLQSAARDGETPPELDIPFVADALLAPLTAHFYRFHRQMRGFSPERISAGLRTLVVSLAIRRG